MSSPVVDKLFDLLRQGRIEEASELMAAHVNELSTDLVQVVKEIETQMKERGEWRD